MSDEKDMYPHDFLEETEDTLRLLFPLDERRTAKRTKRICETFSVDVEAAIEKHASYELSSYPIWRNRLAEVQQRYDAARPSNLRQWWYDRRNKPEWATFWVAVTVFILTVVFGVISSVTGIMQVYAAFRSV